MDGIHTIVGAGGIIADNLASELIRHQIRPRLVSRNPRPIPGADTFAADVTDLTQTRSAIPRDATVYLCVGLPYNYSVWRRSWPRIMDNLIDACKEKNARLIFFDNVYMYGRVSGVMTEEQPYNPCSRKGDLRARIATQLMSEVRKGNLQACIARSADFYGPGADKTGAANLLVFSNLVKNRKAQWLADPTKKHSFTYTPDAARALYILGTHPEASNQVWHLPTAADPLTGHEFIAAAAAAMGKPAGCFILRGWMVALAGIFNRTIGELHEMLYQYRYEYIFDSSKFEQAFNFRPVSYADGIREVVSYLQKASGGDPGRPR
jgi:nucleoside-diphosphate-sugar epimerase